MANWRNIPSDFIPDFQEFPKRGGGIPNDLLGPLSNMVGLFQNNLKKYLQKSYFSKDYNGVVKPIQGGDFGGLHPKVYNGTLLNETQVFVTSINPGEYQFVIDFGTAGYWYYVDKGRKPGVPVEKRRQTRSRTTGRFGKAYTYTSYTKMPPLKDIMIWVEKKPALVDSNLSVETRTYLAMRSIARDGIYGINFIENALRDTEQELNTPMGEYLGNLFQDILNKTPLLKQDKLNIQIKL